MPSRRLPRTNDDRSTAMSLCTVKYNATPNPADKLITSTQFGTLSLRATTWNTARDTLPPLLRAQTTATNAVNAAVTVLERIISHFIQVFNMAIARGGFTASDRTYYQLDESSDVVPPLASGADLRLWAGRIASGETVRVAAGGAPMAMPSAAQVATVFSTYTSADATQTTAKTNFDLGQEAVSNQIAATDLLILDLWDTIEFNLRANDPTSLRRKAREWGVVYDGDAALPPPPVPPTP